jgi:23S rRNA (adenine2503-C2)-methyltransferase
MKNLPAAMRRDLAERFTLYGSAVSAEFSDPDGTQKLQIRLGDGLVVEAVLLSDAAGRKTACLSTQAGCPMACVFCKTGTLPFARNLDASEMAEQFLYLSRAAGEELSHIVIMGMGEPLLNLGELTKAIGIFTAPGGFGLSPRRVTVSTSGLAAGIRAFTDAGLHTRLAVSLATADEALRTALMPVTKTNPLRELKEALQYYQEQEKRRVTLEITLLRGINTRREDVEALVDFTRGLDAVVNLIPWNPVPGMSFAGKPLREPETAEIRSFERELAARGIPYTRRRRRGRAIGGACGQLGVTEPAETAPPGVPHAVQPGAEGP